MPGFSWFSTKPHEFNGHEFNGINPVSTQPISSPVVTQPISPPAVSQTGPGGWLFHGHGAKRVSPVNDGENQLQELRNCRSPANFVSICNNLPQNLKNDFEFMKQAACIKLSVLNYVGSNLQRNSEFWDSVCSLYSKNIQNVLKIRDIQYGFLIDESSNRRYVLFVVRQYGRALQYASSELKDDVEVVMEAVKQNGQALQYASKPCQNMLREDMQKLFLDPSKQGPVNWEIVREIVNWELVD